MKQMAKRLVSYLLTLTMFVSVTGTSAFAVNIDASDENASVLMVDENTPKTDSNEAAAFEGAVEVASDESEPTPTYKEGTFTGTGTGYGGPVTITVQMAKGDNDVVAISDIQAEQEKETPSYWEKKVTILEKIKAANSTQGVDTVSGATLSCNGILEGAEEALTKAGIAPKYIFKTEAGWIKTDAQKKFAEFLKDKPQIDAVLAANDAMGIGAADALAQAGYAISTIPIVGVDATSDGRAAIRDGRLNFTVFQDPQAQGAGAVEAAIQMLGGSAPEGAVDSAIWIGYTAVDAANVDKLFPDER